MHNIEERANYKHREQNMYSSVSVYKQRCSYLHDGLKNLYQYVFHENWDINSKVIIVIKITCNNINSSQKVSITGIPA